MEEQIELNILADDIVSETFDKAIRHIMIKSQMEMSPKREYRTALERLRVTDHIYADLILPEDASSHPHNRKNVTFRQSVKTITPKEPSTPSRTTSVALSFEEDSKDAEITHL